MIFSTSKFINKPAFIATSETEDEIDVEKAGRVHFFAFDVKCNCVGAFIKRPDVALMFQRKDLFAPLESCRFADEGLIIYPDYKEVTSKLTKKHGLNLNLTFVYDGMDVYLQNGEELGVVGDIKVDDYTRQIKSMTVSAGGVADSLLGKREIPGEFIIGVKSGTGKAQLVKVDDKQDAGVGALIVDDLAGQLDTKGGIAKKAAVASVKAKSKAVKTAKVAKEKAAPKAKKAKDKAEVYAEKGKDAAVKTYAETKKGVIGFKEEFLKAFNEGDATGAKKDEE